ncbi:uncharacterized protein LOC141902088 [Tubulanus polymorphus]|uniref:uncharacterized protein LOC141902088 n=1 Tax=Tubulanus polymorphus TaxID=672921 RepID=UPI003DA265F1
MDDSMDSVEDIETAIELYSQLVQLWSKAGMHARKWMSNSLEVLRQIPEENRVAEINLDDGNLPKIKTLGVTWQAEKDTFQFQATSQDEGFAYTKRKVLSKISSLFDPLGFLTPFILWSKIIMQEMWVDGVEWDEEQNPDLEKKIKKWFAELEDLQKIRIPRCIRVASEATPKKVQQHPFVDASQDGYGAVVYAVCTYKGTDEVSSRMIAAKSSVAPLISSSIPRLQMMGAILGLRLVERITEVYEMNMKEVIFWSDSLNVLWWIRNRRRTLKAFIAHRVGEIQSKTRPTQWRYVPKKANPADLASRGITADELADENSIWWTVSRFLVKNEDEWPVNRVQTSQVAKQELKKEFISRETEFTMLIKLKETDEDWRLNPERYSQWNRLLRVHAWVHRFIDNCRVPKTERSEGELSADELLNIEEEIIRRCQIEGFKEEYSLLVKGKSLQSNTKLLSLKPRLDEEGLIRCEGRLKYVEFLAYDVKNPIILPRHHHVTKLIVRHHHEKYHHVGGTNQVLASLSSRYWMISAREAIRDVERECCTCKKRKAKAATQVMAPLPRLRVKMPIRAFARTAVDFGGPFITKQGRGKSREKRYLCLFTCLQTCQH